MSIDNFVVLDSVYGKFIVARTCMFQAEALVKTGRTHIETELNNIFAIVDTLPNDAVVVDGGANIGFFSIPVAHRTKDRGTRIVSFEPQRQLFQALGGSLAINGYDHVYVHNCGLGAEPGTAQLPAVDYSIAQDFGTVSMSDETTVDEHGWMNDRVVDVTSIDAMDLPRLDFFKLATNLTCSGMSLLQLTKATPTLSCTLTRLVARRSPVPLLSRPQITALQLVNWKW